MRQRLRLDLAEQISSGLGHGLRIVVQSRSEARRGRCGGCARAPPVPACVRPSRGSPRVVASFTTDSSSSSPRVYTFFRPVDTCLPFSPTFMTTPAPLRRPLPGSRPVRSPSVSTTPALSGALAKGATARSAMNARASSLKSPTRTSFSRGGTPPLSGNDLSESLMRETEEKEQVRDHSPRV
jgi:hypothetical protein